jgi:hypothetical protein
MGGSMSKITYKGKSIILSNNLLDPPKVVINKPRLSRKFDTLSLYYDGIYYFPEDLKPSTKREDKSYEIQGIFYTYKWYQDTFYISEEFKEFLLDAFNGYKNHKRNKS